VTVSIVEEMSGKENFCVTGELSPHLLIPVHVCGDSGSKSPVVVTRSRLMLLPISG
jgi:hypothetical protein